MKKTPNSPLSRDNAEKLTIREERFVHHYLRHLDVDRAYHEAGYAGEAGGNQLLRKPYVAAAIEKRRAAQAKRLKIDSDRIVREFAKIGFADLSDVMRWGTREIKIPYNRKGEQLPDSELSRAYRVETKYEPYVEVIDSEDLHDDVVQSVAEVSMGKDGIKVKLHDKVNALTQIGRHLGMFNDKQTVDVNLMVQTIERRIVRPGDVIDVTPSHQDTEHPDS